MLHAQQRLEFLKPGMRVLKSVQSLVLLGLGLAAVSLPSLVSVSGPFTGVAAQTIINPADSTTAPTLPSDPGTPTNTPTSPPPPTPTPIVRPAPVARVPISVFFDGSVVDRKKSMDLFYLAFARIMSTDFRDIQSWYALAAIHGTPIPYDGVQGIDDPNSSQFGYCKHGDELFPTWHRPYLLALEHAIQDHARAIITENPNLDAATRADGLSRAAALRLPYWDWDARPAPGSGIANLTQLLTFPSLFLANTVSVSYWLPNSTGTVSASPRSMANPLKQYTLPPASLINNIPAGISPSGARTTFRGIRRPKAYVESFRDDISACFSMPGWIDVSNHNSDPDTNPLGASIESVHDYIHTWVGGTMGVIDIAAYDPVFWFHHCNVDRVTALYQAYQPDSWLISTTASSPTFTELQNDLINSTTRLTPFLSSQFYPGGDNTTFVTSDEFRHVTDWGYTYPELQQMEGMNLDQKRIFLNQLFPPATWVNPGDRVTGRRLLADSPVSTSVSWRVVFEQFYNYFGGSTQIRLFLNSPSASAATDLDDPNLAATVGTFAGSATMTTARPRTVSASITGAVNRLNLASGTVSSPVVDFRSMTVVITGSAVEQWLASATPVQIGQLRADIASDYFTPKIKQLTVVENPHTGEITRTVKRYIGVPITVIIAPDGQTTNQVVQGVHSLSADVDTDVQIPSQAVNTGSDNIDMGVIIGASIGAGVVVMMLACTGIMIYRRGDHHHKSTVRAITTQGEVQMVESNPVITTI